MKSFHCACGQRVFFDSTSCISCGRALGFDPETRDMVALGSAWRLCTNGRNYDVCNWVVPAAGPARYCEACALNDLIPSLDTPDNVQLWGRVEAAKRRLLYTLLSLGLPLTAGSAGPALRFRFMEDRRRNPLVLEDFVGTGHWAGVITINIREADDVARTADREAMQERYRTVLGHFRHESGHYYFNVLVTGEEIARWRELFGDEQADYAATLEAYYRDGPPLNWSQRYVSTYAAAHPYEDWAETFAHYLHIVDALETALVNAGVLEQD